MNHAQEFAEFKKGLDAARQELERIRGEHSRLVAEGGGTFRMARMKRALNRKFAKLEKLEAQFEALKVANKTTVF